MERLRFCEERSRLLDGLTAASVDYSLAASNLSKATGVVSRSEYARIKSGTAAARLASENARAALAQHQRDHGCKLSG
jgi:hypothetical protein